MKLSVVRMGLGLFVAVVVASDLFAATNEPAANSRPPRSPANLAVVG